VKPGQTERLAQWIVSLPDRLPEVRAAMAQEGILYEAIMLEYGTESDPDYLILYLQAENLQQANVAFQASQVAVDLEFKQLMLETLDFTAAIPLSVLFATTTTP